MASKGKGRADDSPYASQSTHGGIQVTITPSSSAFFAGENATFTIVFTNTRPARASTSHLAYAPSASSSRHPYIHRSSSSIAGPVRSAPSGKPAFQPNDISIRPTPIPSPSASFIDLNNAQAGTSHIVVPERRGVIGTPLALANHYGGPGRRSHSHTSSVSVSSPSRSATQPPALYTSKRLPTTARHKKNDYSVAIQYADESGVLADSEDVDEGVSDLSSQLAGMALLQERGSISVSEEPDVESARPYVEQYKLQGEAVMGTRSQGRIPSSSSVGSRRIPSNFSTISEESNSTASPSVSPEKRFSPMRSLSASSVANSTTSTARLPSGSSIIDKYHSADSRQDDSSFYKAGQNYSVDSVLRDGLTSYAEASRAGERRHSGHLRSSTRTHLPVLRPPNHHSRSYSAAVGPLSAPVDASFSPSCSITPSTPGHSTEDLHSEGSETLLWAFAQFSGSFTVEEALVKNSEYIAVKRSLFAGGKNSGGYYSNSVSGNFGSASEAVVGGGSLETETMGTGRAKSGGSWTSWLLGRSAGNDSSNNNARRASHSTSGLPTDPVMDGQARRRSSAAVLPSAASTASTIGSLEERRLRMMNDASVPVFSSPPSILAVDLVLEPGESKTYTFSLQLPGDLPPSFRGKAITFTYNFMVGTNKALGDGGRSQQQSRLVRVPVRVYNHVSVNGVRPFYDLTNPVIWYRDEAKVQSPEDEPPPASAETKSTSRKRQRSGSIELAHAAARKQQEKAAFYEYASSLLDSAFQSPETHTSGQLSPIREASAQLPNTSAPQRKASLPVASSMKRLHSGDQVYNDGGPAHRPGLMTRSSSQSGISVLRPGLGQPDETSCKSAVEIVSRNAQKVSYDITKDGYRIATLTLVKSAYRLGDTVNVMVTLNGGEARVLRIAARLETHELIETTISLKTANQVRQLTRRLHAEHHETTLDSGRTGFALAIPSGATPDFATSGVKLQWTLNFSFLILPPQYSKNPHVIPTGPARSGAGLAPLLSPDSSGSSQGSQQKMQQHRYSKSYAIGARSFPGTPVPVETGSHHLMPVPSSSPEHQYTCYRAVPDLSFIPTLFQSPEAQQLAQRQQDELTGRSPAMNGETSSKKTTAMDEAVVLMPTKIETVDINIPLRVFPSATPFRSPVSTFVV